VHAWDTETIDLNIKEESPVKNGKVICLQCFLGMDVPFENGPRLFIDNFGDSTDLILEFKDYFESEDYKKIWFNYGFDRHVIENHNIELKGFGGDVMHMARLLDPTRAPNEYSLAKTSSYYEKQIEKYKIFEKKKYLKELENESDEISQKRRQNIEIYSKNFMNESIKVNMNKLFARPKLLKNGTESKIWEIPSIIEMHTNPSIIKNWVFYGTLDAELTYYLFCSLKEIMEKLPVEFEDLSTTWDIYDQYWKPFGEVLTGIEKRGIKVDYDYMIDCLIRASTDYFNQRKIFKDFIEEINPECTEFNPSSGQQMQHLLFAPFKRKKGKITKNKKENSESEDDDENPLKVKRVMTQVNDFEEVRYFRVEKQYTEQELEEYTMLGKKPNKFYVMPVKGFGLKPVKFSMTGLPSVDGEVIQELASGSVQKQFAERGDPEMGIKFGNALQTWLKMKQIETLLTTFIISLLQLVYPSDSRIHCSLNINTETGRLSARRPNLQNQPALDKDKYKTRYAFRAEQGNKLIIADYGQLELRVLAHMTNCVNMIEAFKKGGDFHSRTAANMFPNVKEELEKGDLLLENYPGAPSVDSKGEPIMLLKDKFANERKKAKTMNFSIAYGKTVMGFAKDWGCSIEEATNTVALWFSDRPEVLTWQNDIKKIAIEKGYTKTLMGRYRSLVKHFIEQNNKKIMHGLRAAINTPIQGGAADIVIAAMVKIEKDERIKNLGWRLIHQVHDEVILEGREETAEEVLKYVIENMENPFKTSLKLKMEVDAKICDNWYEGK
jgi:DNA polymerase-1